MDQKSGTTGSHDRHDRIPEIDAIKAVAILGVVFGHMTFVGRFPERALSHVAGLQSVLTHWAPLGFFWVSGFLTQRSIHRNRCGVGIHLWKRARRLLVPFFLISLLNNLVFLGLSKAGWLSSDLLPWHNPGTGIHYLVQLIPGAGHYFFLYLFLISLLLDPLLIKGRILSGALLIPILLIAVLGFLLGLPRIAHGPWPELLGIYSLSYYLGAVAGRPESLSSPWFLGSMAGTACLAATGWFFDIPGLFWIAAAPFLFTLLKGLPPLSTLLRTTRLGRQSAAIFAWHSPFLMVAFGMLLSAATDHPILLVYGTALGTIILSIAINETLKKIRPLRLLAV